MQKAIKVRCLESFSEVSLRTKKLLANVKEGVYEAELYEETGEYFAKDHKGREFLVGELGDDEREIELDENFELVEE
ncbi:hypothetical protein LI053_14725 [Clostridium perfringens]|uniref:hypothetical protein n=1 Tax=Clostridium perfringens TaxID=1502 RepID=UPI002245D62A|nr:hypothetical protein [Clostridium perfringens]MCX0386694.1 hypothetical protein [Clostridium perfringens]